MCLASKLQVRLAKWQPSLQARPPLLDLLVLRLLGMLLLMSLLLLGSHCNSQEVAALLH